MDRTAIFKITKETLSKILNVPGEIKFMETNNDDGTIKLYIEGENFKLRPEGGSSYYVVPSVQEIYHVDWSEVIDNES